MFSYILDKFGIGFLLVGHPLTLAHTHARTHARSHKEKTGAVEEKKQDKEEGPKPNPNHNPHTEWRCRGCSKENAAPSRLEANSQTKVRDCNSVCAWVCVCARTCMRVRPQLAVWNTLPA